MPYYPKSQIKTDLYTNGDEYMVSSTQEPYTGYYYNLATGEKYTGKDPDDKPNNLLTVIQPLTLPPINLYVLPQLVTTNDSSYPQNRSDFTIYLPQYNSPLPTSDDYKREIFTRYFCKKSNERKFLEVDQITYNKLTSRDPSILWSLYTPFSIQWKISPDSNINSQYNQTSILKIENLKDYEGFSSYITSLSQYSPPPYDPSLPPPDYQNQQQPPPFQRR